MRKLRTAHAQKIWDVLVRNGPLTKGEIALKTGLSNSQIDTAIREIREKLMADYSMPFVWDWKDGRYKLPADWPTTSRALRWQQRHIVRRLETLERTAMAAHANTGSNEAFVVALATKKASSELRGVTKVLDGEQTATEYLLQQP